MGRPLTRHDLRCAATEVLWRKREMLPEYSDEIVDDVLDVVLPMLGIDPSLPAYPILSDGFEGGFPSDRLVEGYYAKGPPSA